MKGGTFVLRLEDEEARRAALRSAGFGEVLFR